MKIGRFASPILAAGAVALLMATVLHAAPRWVELRTPSFTVVSDGSEREARRVGAQFETFRALLKDLWPWARFETPRPVTILAVRFEEGLKRLLPEFWEVKGGTRPAGVFVRSPERYWVALRMDVTEFRPNDERWRNPYLILFHEYVHVILDLNFKRLPVWLGEGLAEYWGNTVIQDDHVYTGHPIAHHLVTLSQRPVFPLETLLAVTHDSPEYSETHRASIFYAESWALVHYLQHGSDSRADQVARFLNLLSSGRPLEEAQKEAFGDLAVLEDEFASYLQKLQVVFQYGHRTATIEGDAEAFTARKLPEAESLAVRAAFHAARNRPTEARALAGEALALDPELAAAHEAVALMAWREGENDEALQALRRATELPDGSDFAHFLHGQLRWQQLKGAEELMDVEASFRKAVELNPSFAAAYDSLARVMNARGVPLERTLPVATEAVKIEPNNIEHWVTALRLMGGGGYLDEARAKAEELLEQVDGRERTRVESLITELTRWEPHSSPPPRQ
jgi:tetratricopeptide (TPR) repeat protein